MFLTLVNLMLKFCRGSRPDAQNLSWLQAQEAFSHKNVNIEIEKGSSTKPKSP